MPAAPTDDRSRRKTTQPELDADGNPIAKDDDDDDEDEQANMSLAAMEAALKPRVLETLDRIARDYDQAVRHAGPADVGHAERGRQRSPTRTRTTYQKLRSEIVELVNELHLHNNRIEALIDQLYGINRRIMSIDSGDGEAGRPGPHQPPRVHRGLSRLRARPDLARPDGAKSRAAAGRR